MKLKTRGAGRFVKSGGGAASALSFLLVVLIFVIILVPSVSSRNYHNATEVMVNVNGTDRNLQYVFDNHFFNSDLRDRQGLVFADPSSIHHGKHQASEILVSSDGKTGTLLNYLRNKTLPSGFSRNYSIPTHPATMVFFSSGKSLQELVDVGDFSCTLNRQCVGYYSVRTYTDCSTSRHYCSHGCSGGYCRSAPSPPTPRCTPGGFCDGNKLKLRNADCSINKNPVTGEDAYRLCPDGCSNGRCNPSNCSSISGSCDTSRVNGCRSGTLRDVADDDNYNYWYCDGTCGGSNARCNTRKVTPPRCGILPNGCSSGVSRNFKKGRNLPALDTWTWACRNSNLCVSCYRYPCGLLGCWGSTQTGGSSC